MKTYTEEDLKRAWEDGYDKANTEYTPFNKNCHWLGSNTKSICKNPAGGFNFEGSRVLINGNVTEE